MRSLFFSANKLYNQHNLSTRSVAWAEVDVKAHPTLAITKEPGSKMFIVGANIMRKLAFERKRGEELEDAAKRFSDIVITMTADWLYQISCDGIEELIKGNSYFLVYFG